MSESGFQDLVIIGDIHGHAERARELLASGGLIDREDNWTGGRAHLWFIGDFFDRGPSGVAVVDLVMRLRHDSTRHGGRVGALLGNHEVLILAAHRFRHRHALGPMFTDAWLRNGGVMEDLNHLGDHHIAYLQELPALTKVGEILLLHADADFYLKYGATIYEINHNIREVLHGNDDHAWAHLLDDFSERHLFDETRPGGSERLSIFLAHFSADRLIHGHTPINKVTGQDPEAVVRAFVYDDTLAVNVDGGIYRGGPGFLFKTSIPTVSLEWASKFGQETP